MKPKSSGPQPSDVIRLMVEMLIRIRVTIDDKTRSGGKQNSRERKEQVALNKS